MISGLISYVHSLFEYLVRNRAAAAVVSLALALPLMHWVVMARTDPDTAEEAGPAPSPDRTVQPYEGYGAWVDVFDYAPSFQDAGGAPPLTPDAVDDMVQHGVRTLYIQAAQLDPRSPELLVDPEVLGDFVVRARQAGMDVVGWYLPRFDDLDRDLAHLEAIAHFEQQGHQFDGVAVDIEWTQGIEDHSERSRRLVELSRRLREAVGDDALGAITLSPVHLEVVNPRFWPDFPWADLADLYDVWLPMSYWTDRTLGSGLRDGHAYTLESVRRLRTNLDDPEAPVHAIGGIGNELTPEELTGFALASDEGQVIGRSVYDWNTLHPTLRAAPTTRPPESAPSG